MNETLIGYTEKIGPVDKKQQQKTLMVDMIQQEAW